MYFAVNAQAYFPQGWQHVHEAQERHEAPTDRRGTKARRGHPVLRGGEGNGGHGLLKLAFFGGAAESGRGQCFPDHRSRYFIEVSSPHGAMMLPIRIALAYGLHLLFL